LIAIISFLFTPREKELPVLVGTEDTQSSDNDHDGGVDDTNSIHANSSNQDLA
jgi:hypothetical protein